jgi:hypothetical protein
VFLGQAAEAWKSAECTAGILEASVSIGCDSISEAMVDRLAEREEGWQWPERVDSILRARLAQGQECEVDAYIRLQLQNLQNTDRLNGRSRAMDFEPISTLLDLEQAWQGWRDVHRGLFGDSRPLGLDFPLSILTEV